MKDRLKYLFKDSGYTVVLIFFSIFGCITWSYDDVPKFVSIILWAIPSGVTIHRLSEYKSKR